MTKYRNLFADEVTEWFFEEVLIKTQFQMSIYYKYAPHEKKSVVLSYVDYCVYCHTYEAIGKWFLDTLGKISHVNFLGYTHWFMSIRIS